MCLQVETFQKKIIIFARILEGSWIYVEQKITQNKGR